MLQLERLLGLDGVEPLAPGIVYPDTAPQIERVLQVLDKFGVTVSLLTLAGNKTLSYMLSSV